MSQTTTAHIVTFLAVLIPALGITGITNQDLQGTVNVVSVFVGLVSVVWAHFAHKKAVANASIPLARAQSATPAA